MSSAGLTIGAVIGELQAEFPDLSLSKVRFLDAQGVVSPERTPSGYRRYSPRDVDRLRFVLRCQRDRFWPLKVIREALDAYDRGLEPAHDSARPVVPAAPERPDMPSRAALTQRAAPLRLTARELTEAAGLGPGVLGDLQAFGLIRADADGHFDGHAVEIAAAAGALLEGGLQARHLRPFRLAADREVGLVDQLSHRGADVDRVDVVRRCLALHLALVRAALDD